jgi:hypothetical protein
MTQISWVDLPQTIRAALTRTVLGMIPQVAGGSKRKWSARLIRGQQTASLHSERDQRIDAGRTAGGNERGNEACRDEHRQDAGINSRVMRLNLE